MGALHRKSNAVVTKRRIPVGRARGQFRFVRRPESRTPYDPMTIELLPLSFVLILQRPSRFFCDR